MTLKIRVITDSVADIPEADAARWNIGVVPCYVNYGGESYADDGVHLLREDYYNQLAAMDEVPTTAAMPPDVVRAVVEPAAAEAEHLILITTPARLSAIHNSFRMALEAINLPSERYTLIDSGSLSLGIAFQVLVGAQVAEQTGSVQETVAAIKRVQQSTRVWATVGSIDFLRRSGRVGWATASIAGLLDIKPVVEVKQGEVEAVARVRTFKRAMSKMADLAREQAPYDRLGILHINNPDGAEFLRERLRDLREPDITGIIGPTLGTHIGPGSVGIVTVPQGVIAG